MIWCLDLDLAATADSIVNCAEFVIDSHIISWVNFNVFTANEVNIYMYDTASSKHVKWQHTQVTFFVIIIIIIVIIIIITF